jgi:hypothetical protein
MTSKNSLSQVAQQWDTRRESFYAEKVREIAIRLISSTPHPNLPLPGGVKGTTLRFAPGKG